jgi:hypothetical protein
MPGGTTGGTPGILLAHHLKCNSLDLI